MVSESKPQASVVNSRQTRFWQAIKPLLQSVRPPPMGALRLMSSREFLLSIKQHEWLVEEVLVTGDLAVMGGPRKALKTSLAIDLAISLASCTSFLGRYHVPKQRKIAVFSAESGLATLQATFLRIAKSKGINKPEDLPIVWCDQVPKICHAESMQEFTNLLQQQGVEVVVLDPLYLLLACSAAADQPGNLYQIGPVIKSLADGCKQVGVTPIVLHHFTKVASRKPKNQPPDLDDLSQAGIAEATRQWFLVGRRTPFDPATGTHRLAVQVGGSAGQAIAEHLTIEEGQMSQDFGGRTWRVTFDEKTKSPEWAGEMATEAKIMEFLRTVPDGATATDIRKKVRHNHVETAKVTQRLVREGKIRETTIKKAAGKSNRDYEGYALAEAPPADMDET